MKIFISYRHSESGALMARDIHQGLLRYCQSSTVFVDTGFFEQGSEFPSELEHQVSSCNVFLAVIDAGWVASMARLNDPNDWVRREIELALKRRALGRVKVIPVLFDARMPEKHLLPPSIAKLADLHTAPPLRGAVIDEDLATLAEHLQGRRWNTFVDWLAALRLAAPVIALAMLFVFALSAVAALDWMNIDTRVEALTMAMADVIDSGPPSERITTVAIDQTTVAHLGRPLDRTWRGEHARLISALSEAGASVIAFDLYLNDASPYDADLIAASLAARDRGTTVIFGSSGGPTALVLPPRAVDQGLLCIGNEADWARLAAMAARRPMADASLPPGADPKWQYFASLGFKAATAGATIRFVDVENRRVMLEDASGTLSPMPFSRTEAVAKAQTCGVLQPGDQVAQRLIRYTPLDVLRDPVRRHRYQDVLEDSRVHRSTQFNGKIVLVGAVSDKDKGTILRGLMTESREGYEIQADVINTVLQGIDIHPLAPLPQFLLMTGMAGLGMLGRFLPRLRKLPGGLSYALAVPLAYLAFSAWLCAEFHILLRSPYHVAAFAVAYWVSDWILRRREL